jgi:hypothetical protein
MKSGVKQIEEPPSPSDVQGWKDVVAANRLRRLRPEAIVAVLQRLGPNGDQRLLSALITHISDELLRLIKRLVGKNQRNEGQDIIWRAHHQLIVAVLCPNSKDGQGLCKNFRKWVEYRVADAAAPSASTPIATSLMQRRRPLATMAKRLPKLLNRRITSRPITLNRRLTSKDF